MNRCLSLIALLPLAVALSGCSVLQQPRQRPHREGPDEWTEVDRVSLDDLEDDSLTSNLSPVRTVERLREFSGQGPDARQARETYAAAQQQYEQAVRARENQSPAAAARLFKPAADGFLEAAQQWPNSDLEQDALFRAGESYFFANRYPKANSAFERLIKRYPSTRYLDLVESRRFMIARYWLELHETDPQSFFAFNFTDGARPWRDTMGNAIRILDRIRFDDPTGELADDATLAAGSAFLRARRYMQADSFLTDMRQAFPSSEHQFTAHLLGVEAKLLAYQGPAYTGDMLEQAQELIDQIRKQFPQESRQHHAALAETEARIRYLMAEREWKMTEYYQRRREYGAARFYHQLIAHEYADTKFAEQSRQQLAALAGQPDVPPQRLEWLASLFPEVDDGKPLLAPSPTVRR